MERLRRIDDGVTHVIVIIGENRTFDNVYGTYVPKGGQRIANLLSRGIVNLSKFSRGGRIVHSYADHASVLKFIERNWRLSPLTGRNRDNLPNPIVLPGNPYVPLNMPAIGDLFDMFDFDRDRDRDN